MATPLGDRILDVLGVGGPRKPSLLRALAERHGQAEKFDATISELKRSGRIKIVYRYGGPHYALNPKAG